MKQKQPKDTSKIFLLGIDFSKTVICQLMAYLKV